MPQKFPLLSLRLVSAIRPIRFFFVSIITWVFRKSNSFFKFFSEKDDILQLGTLSHNYCFPVQTQTNFYKKLGKYHRFIHKDAVY